DGGWRAMAQGLPGFQNALIESLVSPFRLVVDDDPPTQCLAWRGPAQDISVAAYRDDRVSQFELNPAFLARFELLCSKQPQISNGFACADEKFHFVIMFDG